MLVVSVIGVTKPSTVPKILLLLAWIGGIYSQRYRIFHDFSIHLTRPVPECGVTLTMRKRILKTPTVLVEQLRVRP